MKKLLYPTSLGLTILHSAKGSGCFFSSSGICFSFIHPGHFEITGSLLSGLRWLNFFRLQTFDQHLYIRRGSPGYE
jgi:hypothetical protein